MTIIGTEPPVTNVNPFPEETVTQEDAMLKGSMSFLADAGISGVDGAISPQDYTATIQAAGSDKGVREGLVAKARIVEASDIIQLNTEGKLVDPNVASALLLDRLDKFNSEGKYEPTQDIVEQNAAKFMIDEGIASDDIRGAILQLKESEGGFLDQYQDNLAITLKIDQFAQKFNDRLADQGIFSTLGDAAAYLIPFYQPIVDAKQFGREDVLSSTGLRKRFDEFMSMPYKQQVAFLDELTEDLSANNGIFGDNALAALTQFQQATSLGQREGAVEDIFNILDLTFVGGIFKGFGKTLIAGARVARNAKMAESAAEEVLERLGRGLPASEAEAVDAFGVSMPSVISVESIRAEPISGKILNNIIRNQEELDAATKNFTLPRLNPLEAKEVDARTLARITRELDLKGTKVTDVNVLEETDIRRLSVTFGHGKDGLSGYGSIRSARSGAKRKGIAPDQFTVEEIQGKFYIKVERDGAERNAINALSTELTADTWYSNIPFVRYTAGAKSILNFDLAAMGEVASRNFQKSISALEKPLKSINSLSTKQQVDLQDVIKYGRERRIWYSASELQKTYQSLLKREPTGKEIEAYFANRQLSDFAFKLRNNEVFTQLARAGYQETVVEQMGLRVNGKTVTTIPQPEGNSVAVLFRDGRSDIFGRGELTAARLSEISEELGEEIIRIKFVNPTELPNGQKVNYLLTTNRQASFGSLRAQQLGYEAGGSTIYKGKNFVKQIQTIDGVNGVTYRVNDKTHFAIVSRAEAKAAADDHNEALKAYLLAEESGEARAIAEATDIIQQRTRFNSFAEFGAEIEKGNIKRTAFEVVGDRGTIPSKGNHVQVLDDDFEKFSDDVKEILTTGRLWYSKRGDHLAHPKEGLAPIADPFEAMSAGITNAAKGAAYGNLKIRAVESWVSKYGPHLVEDDAVVSPIQRFMNSEFKSGGTLSAKDLNKAETVRMTIKRLLHTPTVDQQAALHLKDRLIDFLDAKGMRKLAASIGDTDFKALDLMREVSFKARLGMLDISQLIVQMSMTPGVVAASPVHGMRALGLLPWIKMSHRSPAIIDRVAPLVKLTSGMDAATFKAMMSDIRKSGVGLIGSTQGQLDSYARIGVSRLPVLHKIKKFTDHMSYFFESAERANQYLGYSIAWMQNGSKALTTADDIARVSLKSEALAGNMRNSGNAWWQRGILSTATQFQAHPARVSEIMLGAVGAGTTGGLNIAESRRYIAALTAVYGAAAIPLAQYTYKQLADNAEDGLVDRETHLAITSGILGSMLPEISFKRIQPFGQDNLVQEIFKGDKTILELATGPAGDLLNDASKPLFGALILAQLFFVETGAVEKFDPSLGDVRIVGAEFIKEFASNISSINRGLKSYYAFQYGQYLTQNAEVIQDISSMQAAALAIGFPPHNSAVAFEASSDLKQREENLREIAKGNAKLIREAFRTTDEQVRKDKLRMLYINMAIITDENDRRDIQKMTMAQVENMRNITEDSFRKVYKTFGFEKAERLFNYRGEE